MATELLTHNLFMTGIISVGVLSIFLQWMMTLSLKGYVKASANMKTTKKKVMINIKNQFETMYEMNSKVRNMDAYVDKYLIKLRFMGITYSGWERIPFLTAGIILMIACVGAFCGYNGQVDGMYYAELLFASGISLVCLFVFFHIFGIKTRKLQIHIQLADYLENYLANRLDKKKNFDDEPEKTFQNIDYDEVDYTSDEMKPSAEEDMEMLKRLIREMDDKSENEKEKVSHEVAASTEEQSDIELLEEFVQSFLS